MEQQRMKMTQDALYKYLNEHDVKIIRIAELIGKTPAVVISNFRHHKNAHGYPRRFSVENIRKVNDALVLIAKELRGCVLTFGTNQKRTNKHGRTYDPGLIEPLKRVGELLNLTSLVNRLLGWSEGKKMNIMCAPSSKAYGNISESDVLAINTEILAVAGVLESIELVPDENAFDSLVADEKEPIADTHPKANGKATNSNNKGSRTRHGHSFESGSQPWDNTSFSLTERGRLFRAKWPQGVLFFRVNDGYTVEGVDVKVIAKLNSSITPYTDLASNVTTAYMSQDTMAEILPRLVSDGRRVAFTNMYNE